MGFSDFLGNRQAVEALRRMLAAGRLPHSLILAGPQGVGKHTLASMAARALNCLDAESRAAGDFCGLCETCRRIAPAVDPDADEEFAKILAARTKMRAEDRREHPLVFSSHPDVMVFLPDGPLRQISIDQIRLLKEQAQFLPAAAERRVFIVNEADRMDAPGANSMLKILEEPPDSAVLILTASNYYELLPTIRSRGMVLYLGPVAAEEVDRFLEKRSQMPAADRRVAAHLADGSPGRALHLDLAETRRLHQSVFALLKATAGKKGELEDLLTGIESLARETETLESLLGILYRMLADLLHLSVGRPALYNVEFEAALRDLAAQLDWKWILRASERVDGLQRLLRRNVNKQMALESLFLEFQT
jgi:DNA polymerase-3 subunit delta'